MRYERPCALRDRSCGQGKDSSQGGELSHAPVPRQRLRSQKHPPSGASAKLPPLTFHHAKIALVHVTESRVPMHQVLHDWGGRRSKSCTRATSNLVFKNEHACHNDRRGHGEVGSGASLRIPGGGRAIGMLTRTPRPLSDRARGLGWPSCDMWEQYSIISISYNDVTCFVLWPLQL